MHFFLVLISGLNAFSMYSLLCSQLLSGQSMFKLVINLYIHTHNSIALKFSERLLINTELTANNKSC